MSAAQLKRTKRTDRTPPLKGVAFKIIAVEMPLDILQAVKCIINQFSDFKNLVDFSHLPRNEQSLRGEEDFSLSESRHVSGETDERAGKKPRGGAAFGAQQARKNAGEQP